MNIIVFLFNKSNPEKMVFKKSTSFQTSKYSMLPLELNSNAQSNYTHAEYNYSARLNSTPVVTSMTF